MRSKVCNMRSIGFHRFKYSALAVALLFCFSLPAFAVDGVIEINQAKAIAGGVTPGDAPGFPVTIDTPGSYRLTGNLTVPDANTDAIDIGASNVTVDLNGFAIIGPTVCTPVDAPVTSCSPIGSGNGVYASVDYQDTYVLNGTVRGMGNVGIAGPVRVESVRARSNGKFGIAIGKGSSGMLIGNTANGNGAGGIFVGGTGNVTGNMAVGNGGNGIEAEASTVTDNMANDNGNNGIAVTLYGNVSGNTVSGNSAFGLFLDKAVGYANNVVYRNAKTVSGGVQMGTNVCDGTTTCP